MIAVLCCTPTGGGQVEQIARTFGVDWPHLIAQIVSFGIVCALLYWLAYKPVLRDARGSGAQQIAQGLANAEKIKAELAAIEAQRQEVLAAGARRGDAADRRSPRRGGARAATGNAAARSPPPSRSWPRRARRPTQERARMLAELQARSRSARRPDDRGGHRQDPDAGRSAAPRRGDRQAAGGRSRGRVDEDGADRRSATRGSCSGCASSTARSTRRARAASCERLVDASRPRRRSPCWRTFSGWSGSIATRHTARGRKRRAARRPTCAPRSRPAWRAATAPGLETTFAREPGADRRHAHPVGSDVYDGSVQAGLAALEARF